MKGGSLNYELRKIEDSDFKYTIDPERKIWVKNVYPAGELIVSLIQSMDWKSFNFEGEVVIPGEYDAMDNNVVNDDTPDSLMLRSTTNVANKPYVFFGGCAYEIINNVNKNERYPVIGALNANDVVLEKMYVPHKFPNLHDYVDPTGDIDIGLNWPYVLNDFNETTLMGGSDSENPMFSNARKTIFSDYVHRYMRWVYNNFLEKLLTIQEDLDYLYPNSVKFHYGTNEEGREAIEAKQIGNFWLLLIPLVRGKMYKVQLLAKFKGMQNSDHFVEFVLGGLSIKNGNDNYNTYIDYDGFPIQPMNELIKDNFEAMVRREGSIHLPQRHKFYNHVGRFKYLNYMYPLFYMMNDRKLLLRRRMPVEYQSAFNIPILTRISTYLTTKFSNAKQSNMDMNKALCFMQYDYEEGDICDSINIAYAMFANMYQYDKPNSIFLAQIKRLINEQKENIEYQKMSRFGRLVEGAKRLARGTHTISGNRKPKQKAGRRKTCRRNTLRRKRS